MAQMLRDTCAGSVMPQRVAATMSQCSRRGGEARALVGIVAQPVEQLGEAPLAGVDAAAPVDGFEVFGEGELGDAAGLFVGAVIAPEVVVVERLEVGVDGDDAGAGGVERDGGYVLAVDVALGEDLAGCADECLHLVGVGLRGVVGILALALEWVLGRGCAEAAAFAVEQRDTDAEGSKVDSGYDGHEGAPLGRGERGEVGWGG